MKCAVINPVLKAMLIFIVSARIQHYCLRDNDLGMCITAGRAFQGHAVFVLKRLSVASNAIIHSTPSCATPPFRIQTGGEHGQAQL